ncbi:MAG: SpoIIE family protein phosphatase [Raineya sp.]|nr:SpoIIE family protein phosphatase [Raineya sp.]
MRKYICFILIIFLLGACNFLQTKHKYAKKGIIDLSKDSIENIALNGEYFFAWNQVELPFQIKTSNNFLNIPDEWNKYGYPSEGFATYSLIVELPPNAHNLSLKLPNIATAYNLWLNNTLHYSMGKFSMSPDKSVASYQSAVISIPENLLEQRRLQITLQISNYEHFRGGIYNPIYLGKTSVLNAQKQHIQDFELFSIGTLAFMLVFHLILFLFLSQRHNMESLYLVLLCTAVIIRALIINVGSQYWFVLFPSSSFEFLIYLEFQVAYAIPLLIVWFINALLPHILSKKTLKIANILGYILILSALLPTSTYLYSLPFLNLFSLLAFAVELYCGIIAVRRGIKEAYVVLGAFCVSFTFTLLEIAHHSGWLYLAYANISALGMILFLFLLSFVISYRISKAFEKSAYLSKNLEKEVEKRIQELEIKNQQIEKVNENMMASIRYAQRIQNATLPSDRTISKYLKEYFVFYQPRDIVSGDFYWFQNKGEDIYVAVADCTGHGVPGAIMSVMGDISLDYAFFREEHNDVSNLLTSFDRELVKLLNKNINPHEDPTNDGIVIALCKINLKNKELCYTAANSPIIIVRDGVLIELNPDRHIIGGNAVEFKRFSSQKMDLKTGDVIYLFSDGYYDQFGGEKKKKYGTRKFKEFLLRIAPLPIQEQKNLIEKEFDEWKGNYSQIDDVLVMGIKIV